MDDRTRRGPEDPKTVSFFQRKERTLFCQRERIDELHLALAIAACGHSREKLRLFLATARLMVSAAHDVESRRKTRAKATRKRSKKAR